MQRISMALLSNKQYSQVVKIQTQVLVFTLDLMTLTMPLLLYLIESLKTITDTKRMLSITVTWTTLNLTVHLLRIVKQS
jgi:hypothetical protein